jgi:hypothetical protein
LCTGYEAMYALCFDIVNFCVALKSVGVLTLNPFVSELLTYWVSAVSASFSHIFRVVHRTVAEAIPLDVHKRAGGSGFYFLAGARIFFLRHRV